MDPFERQNRPLGRTIRFKGKVKGAVRKVKKSPTLNSHELPSLKSKRAVRRRPPKREL